MTAISIHHSHPGRRIAASIARPAATGATSAKELSRIAFSTLLVTQLRKSKDPLNPLDNAGVYDAASRRSERSAASTR